MTSNILRRNWTVLLFIAFLINFSASAQQKKEEYKGWDNLKTEVPEWLKDAKFGIYFHWGVYTVPAYNSEWYSRSMYVPNTGPNKHQIALHGSLKNFGYKDYIPMFKAEKFNADEWAGLFVKAGAKFAGPVAEHADGFSMWNSTVNPWNAAKMGPKKDIVGELAKAIRKRNMKFITTFHHQWLWGWYPTFDTATDAGDPKYASLYGPKVSVAAWQQKDDAEKPDAPFCDEWLAKVEEVIHQYKPDILYFDSRLGHIGESYRKTMVTDYLGTPEERKQKVILFKGTDLPDFTGMSTHEKTRMNKLMEKTWLTEEPITTYSWSYTEDMKVRPASDILGALIDVVSKNGVYLLDICPKSDGTIPQSEQDVLLSVGAWLGKNGEAIYKTRPWYTYGEGPDMEAEQKEPAESDKRKKKYYEHQYTTNDVRYTSNGKMVYAIMMGKPAAGTDLVLKAFVKDGKALNVTGVKLIGSSKKVTWKNTAAGLSVQLPADAQTDTPSVFKITTAS